MSKPHAELQRFLFAGRSPVVNELKGMLRRGSYHERGLLFSRSLRSIIQFAATSLFPRLRRSIPKYTNTAILMSSSTILGALRRRAIS
jgi:hypothetical protein